MRPSKKPKYKLDSKKFEAVYEEKEKKEKDLSVSDLYTEILRAKSRNKYR